ncbi:MAG TPA: helical backbone metal receptor [Kofleriaceae bacterium]|nr:helical backbone metal receptor [Kofleriaceae bacterium]
MVAACQRSTTGDTSGSGSAAVARIITLSPSATEVVDALGAAPALVGVDDYSDYPATVKTLPKVGSFIAPNLEAIVRLRPTVVVVDDIHAQTSGALHDAHVATVECPMHALPDVKTCLRQVGAALGRTHEADAAIAAIDKAIEDARAHRPAHHPKVLLVIDRETGGIGGIVAAGPGTFNDELLAVVGGDNVLAGAGTKYPKIGAEEVLRAQPDVILDLSFAGKDSLAPWDAVKVPAVATKHVISLFGGALAHPTPRIGEALAVLARAIQ